MFLFGFNIFPGFSGFILTPLAILAAIWAWRDAARLHITRWLWAAVSFSLFPLGFIFYLAYRVLRGKNKL